MKTFIIISIVYIIVVQLISLFRKSGGDNVICPFFGDIDIDGGL